MTTPAKTPASAWLKNAPFDLALAWGWVPFYVWIATTPLVGPPSAPAWRPAFEVAALAALSLNFVHRHFVYFLFFGDADKRQRHPRALRWAAPLALAAVAGAMLAWHAGARVPWQALIGLLGAWNVWHVLMQRHGIARAYAAKSGGGLEARAHGGRDRALLLALTLVTAALLFCFRQETFGAAAQGPLRAVPFLARHPERLRVVLAVAGAVALAAGVLWLRGEGRATPSARLPRLGFWTSTVALLGVFVLHGPVVGYLVFGFAHSLEYILFVQVYSQRRAARGAVPWTVLALGRPWLLVAVSAVMLVAFALARQVWSVPVFVVYYTATSLLHYFYDGLIWRLRRPEVRAPLMAAAGG